MSTLKRLFGQSSSSSERSVEHVPAGAEVGNELTRESVVRALAAHIAAQSEGKLTIDSIDPNAEMCERGYLDSLNYVAFLVFVEETYGTRILDHQLTGSLRTISAIADHLLREKGVS